MEVFLFSFPTIKSDKWITNPLLLLLFTRLKKPYKEGKVKMSSKVNMSSIVSVKAPEYICWLGPWANRRMHTTRAGPYFIALMNSCSHG